MNTKEKLKFSVVAEKGKQELFIYKEFDAPREIVFKAFSDPKLMVKWLGPTDSKMEIEKFEMKSHGSYRYLHSDSKGNRWAFNGVVHECTAPERVIQTFEFEGLPERGHVSMDISTFEVLPGNRTKLTIQSVFRSVADRDGMVQSGMETGLGQGFEKLDKLLTTLK